MVSLKHLIKYCKDYTKIENYEKAIADTTQTWECHHRLEISPFSKRKVSMKFLKEQGLYYCLPPESLILLTPAEHNTLHHKGKSFSSETIEKLKEAHIGRKLSEGQKHKISMSNTGKKRSLEVREAMSKRLKGKPPKNKGKKAFNDGKKTVYAIDCPPGFKPGGLPRKH